MGKPFFIVSLRYTPGLWQHMESFAGSLKRHGFPPYLLISSGFRWMSREYDQMALYTPDSRGLLSTMADVIFFLLYRWRRLYRFFRAHPPAGLLLTSWHPLNFLVLKMAKALYPGIPAIAWIHEPYKDEKQVYGAKALAIFLIEWFQSLSLRDLDVAVLHSRRGLRLFGERYPGFKGVKRLVPLEFQDDGEGPRGPRRYVSFLGRADRAKGIKLFFELVESLAPAAQDFEFQIVTASNIRAYVQGLSSAAREKLRVVYKPRLSDADLREGAGQSLAVLALYKETTQSGVIPVALMKGAPVIGTDIEGLTEWLRPGLTGVVVSREPAAEEIKNAIVYIQNHFGEMTGLCRADYLAVFDDRNWETHYGWLRELLPGGGQGAAAPGLRNP
jgi:glycosyltransferase involved in cell wall biosynthesis